MSGAATAPVPTNPGDKPSRTIALIMLVHRLIEFGQELADALRQQGPIALHSRASWFGTIDVTLILARIARGLHLARALKLRIMLSAVRLDLEPDTRRRPAQRAPRAPRPPRPIAPRLEATDPRLAELPAPEDLALDLLRRPIGAVIADICRDLGILPGHKLWRELQSAILEYNGNHAGLLIDILHRPPSYIVDPGGRLTLPASVMVPASTGPP